MMTAKTSCRAVPTITSRQLMWRRSVESAQAMASMTSSPKALSNCSMSAPLHRRSIESAALPVGSAG